jgi:glycine/D-amino acid oxidase-like deaminating enzyme
METLSVWRGNAAPTGYGMLAGDVSADVLVMGGGITGVTLALLLAEQGRDVVLLEADEIGSGSTGNSTGNLYETVSEGIATIARRFNDDVARRVLAERRATVAWIEERCRQLPEAAFRRCPLVQYAQSPDQQKTIDQEFEALQRLGGRVEQVDHPPRRCPPPPARSSCCTTRRSSSRKRTSSRWRRLRPRRAPGCTSIHGCWSWTPRASARSRRRAQ